MEQDFNYPEEPETDVIEGEDLPEEGSEDAAPVEGEDLPGEEPGESDPDEGENLPGEESGESNPDESENLPGEEPGESNPIEGETEVSISGNDLEAILESISGNDLGEDLSDLKDQLLKSDEIRAQESEAVVEACNELNQSIEYSTLSLSILLGVLIGILLVQPFAAFLKGV